MKLFANPKAHVKSKHGQYQIAVLGDVIAVSAEGVASNIAIETFSRDMMRVIATLNGKKWAFLGLLHGSALLTREAELQLQKSIEWRAQHGMALGALVTGETTIETLVQSQFERIYHRANMQLGIFKDENSAIDWLAKQGFSTSA